MKLYFFSVFKLVIIESKFLNYVNDYDERIKRESARRNRW